ncbi:TBC1 domain family member 3B-like isoform X1 [Canis aureus]
MSTGIYTPKWFLQCFLGRTPFSLTLNLWDAYVLDGERVLTARAYTILKVHRKRLLKLPLEGLREFLQDSLAQPWALEDEAVLRHLRASMTQLRRMRWDLSPPGRDLRSSPRGPWAWSECPPRPGLSSLLRPLRHRPGWRSRPPRAQPPSLSRPDPLPARPLSNSPPPPPAMELTPHRPSASRRCRQAASRHSGLQDKKRGPLPFGTCLGHPRCPATDQALEHPRDSHHSVPPAP